MRQLPEEREVQFSPRSPLTSLPALLSPSKSPWAKSCMIHAFEDGSEGTPRLKSLKISGEDCKLNLPPDFKKKNRISSSPRSSMMPPLKSPLKAPLQSPLKSPLKSPLRSPLSCKQVFPFSAKDEVDLSWSAKSNQVEKDIKKNGSLRKSKSGLMSPLTKSWGFAFDDLEDFDDEDTVASEVDFSWSTESRQNEKTITKNISLRKKKPPTTSSSDFAFDDSDEEDTLPSIVENGNVTKEPKMVWTNKQSDIENKPEEKIGFTRKMVNEIPSRVRLHRGTKQEGMYADISRNSYEEGKDDGGKHKFQAVHVKCTRDVSSTVCPKQNGVSSKLGHSCKKKNRAKDEKNLMQRVFLQQCERKNKATATHSFPKVYRRMSSVRSFVSSNVPKKLEYKSEKNGKDQTVLNKSLIANIDDEKEDAFFVLHERDRKETEDSGSKDKMKRRSRSLSKVTFGLFQSRKELEEEILDDYVDVDDEFTIGNSEDDQNIPVAIEDPKRLELIVRDGVNNCVATFGNDKEISPVETFDVLNPLTFSESIDSVESHSAGNKMVNDWEPIVNREKFSRDDGHTSGPLEGQHFC